VLLIAPAVSNAVSIDLRDALFAGPRFWVFAGALLAAVTVLGGAYPAFVLSLVRPVEALRLGRARASSRFASTLLVGTQFAAASFLLIMVIVMYAQNADLRRTGLRATNDPHLVIASLSRVTGIETEILHAELARIPQVKGVTQMGQPPWANGVGLTALARTPDASAGVRTAVQNVVGYDFFSTLEIPLVAGRAFERGRNDELPRDSSGSDKLSPINFVVDRVLAAELGFAMPADAIDQIVYLPGAGDAARPMNIIGVVESRPLFLRGFGATANAYLLAAGGPGAGMQNHIVRLAAQDVAGGVAAIDAMWRRLGARTPLQRRFMDEMFDDSYEQFARVNQVFAVLAAFAFFISIVGLFGMAIQVAGRRVHEIGVRKSVGATKAQMVGMLLRDFARPVVIANLVAWPLAYVGAQAYLSVFIQRIGITPAPFLLSLGIVVLIACIAVGGQALRAARANPAEVLRFE
jgi:putative ABC transport system permease protein